MNWKVKAAVRRTLLSVPRGAALYRYLTARVLGTQHGMAAKWFRVFPAHVRVLQEKFGHDARNAALWCFDSGATAAAGFAAAVASDAEGLLTDRWGRLSDTYLGTSREILRREGGELAKLSRAEDGCFVRVCDSVSRCLDSADALRSVGMSYAAGHEAAGSAAWRGRIGLVFSAGSFEHYAPAQVDEELHRMSEALRPGGVLSHVVDHRDHRWHADKSIPPLLHLKMERSEYEKRYSNPLDYHNRWMKSDWLACFERHGFEVEARTVISATPDLVALPREEMATEFRRLPEDDLNSLVTHFVAVKSPQGPARSV